MTKILPAGAILLLETPTIQLLTLLTWQPPCRTVDPARPESRKLMEDVTMSTKTEPGVTRTKKIEVELPEGLYDLMEKVCAIQDMSVNDYLINSAVVVLDGDLDMCLADLPDLGILGNNQRAYVESLAWPERVAEEATV